MNTSTMETARIARHQLRLGHQRLCLCAEWDRTIEIGSTAGMKEMRDVFGWIEQRPDLSEVLR